MSEQTEKKPEPEPDTQVSPNATEKRAYVRYVGKMPSVSHQGAKGKEYFFSKDSWVLIEDLDIPNYTKKAEKNSHNWEFTFKEHTIYEEVHKVRFKGTDAHKEEITLMFDDEHGEKTVKYIFKIDLWTVIHDDAIAKTMSNKALQNQEIWAYQLDKVPVKRSD